jgi:hypothetical protein
MQTSRTWLLLVCAFAFAAPARAEDIDDLRGVRIGMTIAELPDSGYRDFTCATTPPKPLAGWSEWRACAPDAAGARALRVAYDRPGQDDTLIAGHPVDLTLSFDEGGRLARILIETDDHVPRYLHKKAYLFGLQAKARYGDDDWDCRDQAAAAGEEPIGATFLKQHCEKSLGERRLTIDRGLFRRAGSDAKDFVSETRVSIAWSPSAK